MSKIINLRNEEQQENENGEEDGQNLEQEGGENEEEDIGENGEEENGDEKYKIEGEEGEENNGQEKEEERDEEQIEKNDEESLNNLQGEEPNPTKYNIEEYFPYDHKHDQYSCSCCEHYYFECIQKKEELPEVRCEVCGNEINLRSLQFYMKKKNEK